MLKIFFFPTVEDPPIQLTEAKYKEYFGIDPLKEDRVKAALGNALEIRKFEIELYWKRTAYFWALIAAVFAGFFVILNSANVNIEEKNFFAYIVGCIGALFNWAWLLVNRGSKYWQENWENHVDMLEDKVTGPLYKTILHRPKKEKDIFEYLFVGAISVSKTNQWVSLFTFSMWIVLICQVVPDITKYPIENRYIAVAVIAILFVAIMAWKGRTYKGKFTHIAEMRKSEIKLESELK